MFERFTDDARAVVRHASEHARRLGHRYVGGEHLLLAVVSMGQPASAVLREQGVTPVLVEEEIVRRVGLGTGAGLFAGLDKDALATIGIDLDAVRARIEASFGPQVLADAAQAAHGNACRRPGRRPPGFVRAWRRKRRLLHAMTRAHAPAPAAQEAIGLYQAPGPLPGGHIPFTPVAKKLLQLTLREALALQDSYIGVQHIALALLAVDRGMVPSIVAAADASAPALRTAILDRYRQAS